MSAKPTNPDKENTIPLDVAEQWTAAWREKCPDNCKAFLIPAADFVEVLNEIGVLDDASALKAQKTANKIGAAVRGYLAIGSETEGIPPTEKIIFVGTEKINGVYKDILDGKIDGQKDQETTLPNFKNTSSGIYDFTEPCPNTCDFESPLNDDNK